MQTGNFDFISPTKTAYGKSALTHLPFDLHAMNVHQPLVITSPETGRPTAVSHLIKAFNDSRMEIGIYDNADARLPLLEQIRDLTQLYLRKGFDAVIALGGGFSCELARMLNISVSCGPEAVKNSLGENRIPGPLTPLVYLACGPGNGRETSRFLEVFDRYYSSSFLMPDIAMVDPVLFSDARLDLRFIDQTLTSLCVCAEAAALSENPLVRSNAATALSLIMSSLPDLIPGLLTKRTKSATSPEGKARHMARLSLASAISGAVLSNEAPLLCLKLGRSVARITAAPEGRCMSLFLPHVLELQCAEPQASRLLISLGDIDRAAVAAEPGNLSAALTTIATAVNALHTAGSTKLPGTLPDTGLTRKDAMTAAQSISRQTGIDASILTRIVEHAMTGAKEAPEPAGEQLT